MTSTIYWTHTDEAPALATYALLPVIRAYTAGSDIHVDLADISLAGRVIANFPDHLTDDQKVPDWLAILGEHPEKEDAGYLGVTLGGFFKTRRMEKDWDVDKRLGPFEFQLNKLKDLDLPFDEEL